MNGLTKIKNVMKKVVPDTARSLVGIGRFYRTKRIEQAKQFTAATEVNALAVTKLDGTAKGGVVIGISDHFRILSSYIGLGEGMEDLRFSIERICKLLFGE